MDRSSTVVLQILFDFVLYIAYLTSRLHITNILILLLDRVSFDTGCRGIIINVMLHKRKVE